MLDHREVKFYTGPPSAESVERFLPLGLGVPQIITLVQGGPPLSDFSRAEMVPGYMEGRPVRKLILHRIDGLNMETVYLARNELRILGAEVGPEDGAPLYRLLYGSYDESLTPAVPKTIEMQHLDSGEIMVIRYDEIKVNPDLSETLFRQTAPAGVRPEPIPSGDEGS